MEVQSNNVKSILKSYSRKMNKKEQFNHILREIKKHDSKLKKLKKKEDWKGHFKEEVCDVYILASLLIKLEKVNKSQLNSASKKIVDKVKGIYQ